MEDDDEFGDLYTDVLRPLEVKVQPQRQQTEIATAAGNEPPPSQGRPIDPNLDSDDEEILYGASKSMTSDLKSNLNPGSASGWSSNASVREETLPEHRGVDLNLHSNSGAARNGGVGDKGFAARVLEKGHGLELCGKASEKLGFMVDDDDINIIVEETEDRDEDLVENADNLMIKNEKMYATAVQGENTMNFLNETAVGEMGSQQMIPGLSGRLENPGAPSIEDEWESEESDDDLQIVLNDNNHGPMGMERMIDEDDQDGEGLVIVADNADVSHHQNQAQRMLDEQEWGGDEGGSGADGEKDSLDTTKASGGGGGAAPAAAQPKIAYSNHAFHHPFSSQFKYVRPGAAPLPPGGQVRPPISTGPPAGRGRGDWRPAAMQKAFHPGYGAPAWGGNAAGRGYGSGLDFTLPSHKTIFEVDIDSFEDKPWKLPGIDVSDFFNFGLNEDNWRDYCKQLEQLRLEMTMQSKIRVYESGRAEQDYDPDLPPELAAAAVGIQDNNHFQNSNHGKVDAASSDLARAAGRDRTSLPVGRPISVETGYGERMPSIDTRRPRMHDIDAIIEIVCQGSADGDETPEQQDSEPSRNDHDEDDGLQPVDADHMDSSYSLAHNNGNKREFESKNAFNNDGIVRKDVPCQPSEVDDREIDVLQEERSTEGRRNKRGKAYHTRDGKQSPASSSSHSVRSDREPAVVDGDAMNDGSVMDDRSIDLEKQELSSGTHEDGNLHSIKKQKINSQEYSDGKDSKTARSYDRSGSSEHLQGSRDDVDDEAQHRHPLRAGSKTREVRDEDNAHSKRRDNSFSRTSVEAKTSFHQHGKADWNRRDKDYRGGRTRLEDPRKRDYGPDVSPINRDKLREKEKDDHQQSRNQIENGSWRGSNYEYDSRQRDRDDHLKSRSERVDDLHSTRKREESQMRQIHAEKDDISHNHKENSIRRKRERDDSSDQLKRDDQGRSKDNELRYARQKEGGSSQRPRERDDWHKTKQDDLLSKRERIETKPVMRSGRAADEKAWISHSRGNDDYRGSSRDYHPKDIGRHGDQPKQRDRVENESLSQRRSHEDAYARGNQLSNDEKRARYEKSISRNDRGSDTNSRPHDYKRKETTRKGKESDSGDQTSLIPSKRNQNEVGGTTNETANLRGRSEQQSGPGHVNQQQSSRKHKEEASTDDEQPDSRRGRSKMERWGSHKEKDFAISSSSLKKRDRDTHKSSSGASVEVPSEKIEDRPQPPAASDNKESGEEMNNNDENTKAAVEVKHLDTVAKLKKRSERFKLPMPSDKDTVAVKKMEAEPLPPGQPETRPDSEIKSERPARKRRWTGN